MEPWIGQEERDAVLKYMESGGWLTEYKYTRQFESMIADYVGARYASVVCNGTISLLAALLAAGIRMGDEVIVPDFTMIASANSVIWAGGTPVLVDVDEKSLCLDLEKAEKAITKKTKAIVFVSLNGRAANMEALLDLCRKHGLILIEDAAQSLGARYKGKHMGTFGAVGSFSFSAPKIITTGQGGALVTDRADLYEAIIQIRDFGRKKPGVDEYVSLGYNMKFTDIQAVIGIEQMKKLEERVERKKSIYRCYFKNLEHVPYVRFIRTDLNDTPPWFIDVLVEDREALAEYLNQNKIGSRPFYPPVHTQSPYNNLYPSHDFPVATDISKRGLWLPSSSFLSEEDINFISQTIEAFYANK